MAVNAVLLGATHVTPFTGCVRELCAFVLCRQEILLTLLMSACNILENSGVRRDIIKACLYAR